MTDSSGGELFPREELTEEVGRALRQQDLRSTWFPWAVGVGVTLLALGSPTERLWGSMQLVTTSAEGGRGISGLSALLSLLGPSLGTERAALLVAALCGGLIVPATHALLRCVGFVAPVARAGTLLAAATPLVLLGATTATEMAPSILGATILAAQLFRLRPGMGVRAHWRVTLALFLAVLLDPANLLLLPAAAAALTRIGSGRGIPASARGVALVAVFAWITWLLLGAGADPGGQALDQLLASLLAGAEGPRPSHLLGWLVWLPPALGVTALGWLTLVRGRRAPEEAAPPRWVLAWGIAALAPLLGGSPEVWPAMGMLVPLGIVGLADHLVRMEQEDAARKRTIILLLSQVVLAAACLVGLRVSDPELAWREHARLQLQPGDLVVTADTSHTYLLRHRFGLEVVRPDEDGLTALLERVISEGRRVFWDGPRPSGSEDLPGAPISSARG